MSNPPWPDRRRTLLHYRELAPDYDAACEPINEIRDDAVRALRLHPGETAFDIACGTGTALIAMARQVAPNGRVIGVELVPEMAAIARAKIDAAGLSAIASVHIAAAEEFLPETCADAILFCYAHDVLQSPAAIQNILQHANPACRVSLAGWRWVPWWWGFGLNAFNAWRARRYLSTFAGLRAPYWRLAAHLAAFAVDDVYYLGSHYRAYGVVRLPKRWRGQVETHTDEPT